MPTSTPYPHYHQVHHYHHHHFSSSPSTTQNLPLNYLCTKLNKTHHVVDDGDNPRFCVMIQDFANFNLRLILEVNTLFKF